MEKEFKSGSEIVCELLEAESVSKIQLSKMMGFQSRNAVQMMLSRNMSYENVVKCLDVMGYDLVVVKRK